MKKIILMLLVVLLSLFFSSVSASSITYNLIIDDEMKFHEKIIYEIDDSEINKNSNEYDFLTSVVNDDIYFSTSNSVKYAKTKTKQNNGYIVTLTNNYSSMFLKSSRILKECFQNISYEYDANKLKFSSYSPFYCSNRADDITINITTDLNVINHNADSVNTNIYTWNNIDKDFSLSMSVTPGYPEAAEGPTDHVDSNSHISNNISNNQEHNSTTSKTNIIKYAIIAVCIIFIILFIVSIILKKKNSELNKI